MEKELLDMPILIVDDTAHARELVLQCLWEEGFTNLRTAVDGEDAMEQVREELPDLVILDLNMPRLDGKGVCRALRAEPRFADIPVLVQTALDLDQRVSALDAGASDVMPKPLHIPELVARTRVHLLSRLHRRERDAFSRRIREELAQASAAQRLLLPPLDELQRIARDTGVRLDITYRPSSELGGDLAGLRLLSNGAVAVFMFDFSGHGMVSALNAFRLHALISEDEADWAEPARLLELLNAKLRPVLTPMQFATFFWGVVDTATMRFRYASAGAPGCLRLGAADAAAQWLDTRGFPLGVTDNPGYREQEVELTSGDCVLLFSDALIETPRRDAEGNPTEPVDEAAIAQWAAETVQAGGSDSLAQVITRRFVDACGDQAPDDLTLLSIQV